MQYRSLFPITTAVTLAAVAASGADSQALELTALNDSIRAAAEWQRDNGAIHLRLEVEDAAITPPWRGIRNGDHIGLTLSNATEHLEFTLPVPSYAETQVLPIAGLPPSKAEGDILLPAQISEEEKNGAISLTFDTGKTSMALANAAEIRLEWRQTTGTAARVKIDGKLIEGLALCSTDKVYRVNLWEPMRLRSEQPRVTISLEPPEFAKISERIPPRLIFVPETGTGYPLLHAHGSRTRLTYSVDFRMKPEELGIAEPTGLTLTIYDAALSARPEPAARGTLHLQESAPPTRTNSPDL